MDQMKLPPTNQSSQSDFKGASFQYLLRNLILGFSAITVRLGVTSELTKHYMKVASLPERGEVVNVNNLSVREIIGSVRGPRGVPPVIHYYNEYGFLDDKGRELFFCTSPTRMTIGSKKIRFNELENNSSLKDLKNGNKIRVSGRGKYLPGSCLTLNGKKL